LQLVLRFFPTAQVSASNNRECVVIDSVCHTELSISVFDEIKFLVLQLILIWEAKRWISDNRSPVRLIPHKVAQKSMATFQNESTITPR